MQGWVKLDADGTMKRGCKVKATESHGKLYPLNIYVGTAYTTNIKCRGSMGGKTALFTGTAITYTTKWQITVSISLTEAKFNQAVFAAKMAKYLRVVLNKLGIQQYGSKDNAAAIMMANNKKPNGWTGHININYFVLQEWVIYGEVKLAHIQTVANQADALTKALG
eukprot:8152879-Ditylum_brightwellii.AAC.1